MKIILFRKRSKFRVFLSTVYHYSIFRARAR